MVKKLLLPFALIFLISNSNAQVPMQFSGLDCNGNPIDLYADLDAGKAVILHFFMPNCGSCPPPAQKIQTMANHINAMYPGMVKGYAFPYQNSTTCSYASSWVSSNGLGVLYSPMDSGAAHVAHYGGFGMPTVVVLGGAGSAKRVLFSTLSFSTSDTTIMRDSILSLLSTSTGIEKLPFSENSFSVFPNPANDCINILAELNKPCELLIDIADITGKQITVISDKANNGNFNFQFNTSALQDGNYLVRLTSGNNSLTQRISIKH